MVFNILGLSLDKIMELKNLANNNDLFEALKKQTRKQKQMNLNKKVSKVTERPKTETPSVFDFINNKLRPKKGKFVVLLTGGSLMPSCHFIVAFEVYTGSTKICEAFGCYLHPCCGCVSLGSWLPYSSLFPVFCLSL